MTNEEKMLDILASMSLRLDNMAAHMATKDDVSKINIRIETEIIPRLDALAEGFAGIVETHVPREEFDDLADRVELLEMAQ